MQLTTINANDKFYKIAYELYQNSFPYLERRDDNGHNFILTKPDYRFGVLIENGEFLGVMLYFETKDFIYLEHFAVSIEKRGNGIGAKGLEILKNQPFQLLFSYTRCMSRRASSIIVSRPLFQSSDVMCSSL